jgi:RNA polymerase sigma-70 factor (ECF subfamily)
MQRLAARLLQDPHAAEDAAQESVLVAWRSGAVSAAADGPRFRAWLGRIVATQAWRVGRRRSAELQRERRAARPEAVEASDDIVARAEQHERLVAAVLALEEPYRSTLLRHFFDGLAAPEIAARAGLSPVAVRKRISRGVELLRARLVAREWFDTRALLLLAVPAPVAPKAALVKGMVASAPLEWFVGAACLLVLCCGWFVALGSGGNREAQSDLRAAVAEGAAPAPRLAVTTPSAFIPASASRSPALQSPRLVVVDEAGLPRSGARVLVATHPTRAAAAAEAEARLSESTGPRWRRWLDLVGEELLPAPYQDAERGLPVRGALLGLTDGEGSWTLSTDSPFGPGPDAAGWVVEHEAAVSTFVPRSWVELALANGDDTLRVTAATPRQIVVRVEGGEDGQPSPNSFVRFERTFDSEDGERAPHALVDPLRWYGPTSEDGSVRVDDLPCGATLWATALGDHGSRPTALTAVEDPATTELRVPVWRYGRVRGRLVDGEGRAAQQGLVRPVLRWALVARHPDVAACDTDGRFELPLAFAGQGSLELCLQRGAQLVPVGELAVDVPAEGVLELGDVIVREPATLTGMILGLQDRAEVYQVELRAGQTVVARSVVARDGTFRLTAPLGRQDLVVVRANSWQKDRELAARSVDVPGPEVVIDLRGRFGSLRADLPEEFPTGVDIAARLVGEPPRFHPAYRMKGARFLSSKVVATPAGTPAFTLQDLDEGDYTFVAQLGDLAQLYVAHVRVTAGRCTDLGLLRLAAAQLSGVVLDTEGAPVEGARIRLAAVGHDFFAKTRFEREVQAGEAGEFLVRDVVPGEWFVWAECADGRISAKRRVPLENGGDAWLELVVAEPAWITGTVLRGARRAADERVTWSYAAIPEMKFDTDGPMGSAVPGADGRFELGPFAPGEYVIRLHGTELWAKDVVLGLGQRLEVSFDLTGERVTFSSDCRGLPCGPSGWLHAISIDSKGPWAGSWGFVTKVGEDLFSLPRCPTPWLLQLQTAAAAGQAFLYAVVDGEALAGSTVTFGSSSLVVDREAGVPAPAAHLVGVGEYDLAPLQAAGCPLLASHQGQALVIYGLPGGAHVLLQGIDAEGVSRERLVTVGSEGATRVRFPE